jgi:hypothetical protein
MGYRGKYRISDKVIVGYAYDVPSDYFDDSPNFGTTVEFSGRIPSGPYAKTYNDDSEGSEYIEDTPKYNCYYELTTALTDSDGDGIVDLNADGSTTANITITKKAADGSTVLGDVEDYFCEIHGGGALDKAEGSLDSSGTDTIVLQASLNTGMVVTIKVWPQAPTEEGQDLTQAKPGELRVKFI